VKRFSSISSTPTFSRKREKESTRVLLVADTHGQLDERIAAIARECGVVVHAGDVGNVAVLETLGAGGANVIAVRGNNDVPAKWAHGDRSALDKLDDVARIDLPGGVLVATHGDAYPASKRHACLRAKFSEARAVVYGHSHRLVVDETASPLILNPGAAGRARTYGGPSCLLLRASMRGWRIEPLRFERISVR
jgi:putative phosphoesterase